jgi:hypothetical protein
VAGAALNQLPKEQIFPVISSDFSCSPALAGIQSGALGIMTMCDDSPAITSA